MPYKANADRHHKIPRARYRVTNWPDFDAALVRRASLTLWVTEEVLAAWRVPMTSKRGGQPVYVDVAIETGLALRLVFHQPLRQTEGAMRSILKTGRAWQIRLTFQQFYQQPSREAAEAFLKR